MCSQGICVNYNLRDIVMIDSYMCDMREDIPIYYISRTISGSMMSFEEYNYDIYLPLSGPNVLHISVTR